MDKLKSNLLELQKERDTYLSELEVFLPGNM